MDNSTLKTHLKTLFPVFTQSGLIQEIVEKSQLIDIPKGHQIFGVNDFIEAVPLVLKGSIKVMREDQEANEIFLYYIQEGQSCAMTLSSCLKREQSSIKAIAESDTQALILSVGNVYDFTLKYPNWNEFVVQTFANRFEEVLDVVDRIAFQNMDVRLMRYLMDKAKILGTDTLSISKTAIAKDLNSSREVISRLLKKMEENNLVKMDKNYIKL